MVYYLHKDRRHTVIFIAVVNIYGRVDSCPEVTRGLKKNRIGGSPPGTHNPLVLGGSSLGVSHTKAFHLR